MAVAQNRRHLRRKLHKKKDAPKATKLKGFDKFYHDTYKSLFLITIALLIFSIVTIGVTYANTGSFFYKGVSLSGGLTLSLATEDSPLDIISVENDIAQKFPDADINIREMNEFGKQIGLTIEAATLDNTQDSLTQLEDDLLEYFDDKLTNVKDRASSEIIGPSLGASFFQQTAKAVLIAFAFMGMVVFIYFGSTKTQKAIVVALTLVEAILIWYVDNTILTILALALGIVLLVMYIRFSIPSAAVILAAVSTMLFTVAVLDIMKYRISTAGIAAFLMLIGYSVDTDILLSTRVLKRAYGTVYERVKNALKTGLTMTGTTLIATSIAFIFTKSTVIKEIMMIIGIGLFADIFFTWIQNVGLLRLYLERKAK